MTFKGWSLAGFATGLVLLVSAAISATEPKAAVEGQERARLVGVWKGFTVEGKGENPDRGPVKLEMTITERVIRGIQIRDKERIDHGEGEYTLNLGASPHHLDAVKTIGQGRTQSFVGVYKLEGDTLHWCVSPQKVRPESFETKKGQFLLIFKRDAGER